MRTRTPLINRLTVPFVLVATIIAAVAITPSPAHAAGIGRACIFIQPNGADGRGHVGWGFRVSQENHWFFGATEFTADPDGRLPTHAPARSDIGFWAREGTVEQMFMAFVRQPYYPRNFRPYPAHAYTHAKCKDVPDSAVLSAKVAIDETRDRGYDLFGNNCMNHAHDILIRYNTKGMPSLLINWNPRDWYNAFGSDWSEYQLPAETWANPTTGKYADIKGVSTAEGAILHQWQYTGADNQFWWRIDAGNGHFKLVNRLSWRCLDIAGPSKNDRVTVHQWNCYDTDSQLWRWEPTGGTYNGYPVYRIVNKFSGKCLDIEGSSADNGARIYQFTCHNGPNQHWW